MSDQFNQSNLINQISQIGQIATFLLAVTLGPPLTVGALRKVKARLQSRIGAPIWQPLLDIVKLLRKGETLSDTSSWLFRFAAVFCVSAALYLALIMPWLQPKPNFGAADLFVVIYLFAGMRFFTLLAAMDTGSAFGAFAASREATLAFLVEPAAVLSLAALAVAAKSCDLNVIFGSAQSLGAHPGLWILSGSAFFLASLVELSRMPVDDPTTHLELTMVHEALILEASGSNLALFEYASALKMVILFGISWQCVLHAVVGQAQISGVAYGLLSASGILLVACLVGTFESVAVKLNWRKTPEFIAYALTLAFIASRLHWELRQYDL